MPNPTEPTRRSRYCGSKHPHEPHEKPMIGDPDVIHVCRGKPADPWDHEAAFAESRREELEAAANEMVRAGRDGA